MAAIVDMTFMCNSFSVMKQSYSINMFLKASSSSFITFKRLIRFDSSHRSWTVNAKAFISPHKWWRCSFASLTLTGRTINSRSASAVRGIEINIAQKLTLARIWRQPAVQVMSPLSERQLSQQSCTKPWPLGQHEKILFFSTVSTSHLRWAKKGPHKGANFLSSSECVQDRQTKRMIFVEDLLWMETKEQYSN